MKELIISTYKKQDAISRQLLSHIQNTESAKSAYSPADYLLTIQRTFGNRALQRLLKSGAIQANLNTAQLNGNYEPLAGITSVADKNSIKRVVWVPDKTVDENKRPFRSRPDVVGTDSENAQSIMIWKPNKGDYYWCHGYTFDGWNASNGRFSTYGKDVQEKVLATDGWKETRSCHAQPGDIIVFYGYVNKVSHSGIIREIKFKLRSERFCRDPMLRLVIDNLLTLRKGMRGPQINRAVQIIQEALLSLDSRLPIYGADGLFGPETENAVCDYQMKKGLSFDGRIGPETLGSLDSEPQFLKSGLIDEEQSMLQSKWGLMPLDTLSWLTNAKQYGKYICHSKSPVNEPGGARADHER